MKVPADFRRDLAICHLVDGLQIDDVPPEFGMIEVSLQLNLGLAGTPKMTMDSTPRIAAITSA